MVAAMPLAGAAAGTGAPEASAQRRALRERPLGARPAAAPTRHCASSTPARDARGLAPLGADARLARAARRHAADMVARGFFSHDAPGGVSFVDRLRRVGYASSLHVERRRDARVGRGRGDDARVARRGVDAQPPAPPDPAQPGLPRGRHRHRGRRSRRLRAPASRTSPRSGADAAERPLIDSARVSPKIQAPRGTFDMLGDDALAREALEEQARRILERAGYARIETPTFEATELFARGVGESTDVVQKEMYTLDEGPSESLTLRPEGTAPVCRAYLEHGMHKLPQPVKLWYLSSFYRRERPQAGRYRQFWQVGAEAIGSDDPAVDAETILLLAELLEARRRARAAPAAVEPRHAGDARGRTGRSSRTTCARTRPSCPTRCARASTSTRCAPSTPTTPARAA